jgi:hypothetical protein
MKKKMLISLVACFIAAGSFVHYNFAQNNHNSDISLADIAVMAEAQGEIPPDTYYCFWDVQGGVAFIRICYACNIMPFVWPKGHDGMCWTGGN